MNTLSGLVMFGMILVVMLAMMLPLYAQAVTFIPPVKCEIGTECFIQNYVDIDPTDNAQDYQCGNLTYDGHKGTDFRVRDVAAMLEGVEVIAAADGKVKAVRDGELDRIGEHARKPIGLGRECGNGIVISHNSGFETQYCHLMKGSVRVAEGDTILQGQPLGKIGYSGKTEFPHLHFSVRQDDDIIDPFLGRIEEVSCTDDPKVLWHRDHRAVLTYQERILFNLHFSVDKPAVRDAREGKHRVEALYEDDNALVIWSDTMALREGDTVQLTITMPNGAELASHSVTVDRPKAQQFVFTGKRRPSGGWLPGEYIGKYTLQSGDEVLESAEARISLMEGDRLEVMLDSVEER